VKIKPLYIFLPYCFILSACVDLTQDDSSSWKVEVNKTDEGYNLRAISPAFIIDTLYKSMRGPVSGHSFSLNLPSKGIHWLTGYSVKAYNKAGGPESEDFICHNNLDFNLEKKADLWTHIDPSSADYPRLITLTQGQTQLRFPEGFGVPVKNGEQFSILTQVLNHNYTGNPKEVFHETTIVFQGPQSKKMRPLREKTVFVMLPFDEQEPNKRSGKTCIPVDPNDHRYRNVHGGVSSGHWVIKSGKSTYRHDITRMLDLRSPEIMHYAGVHTHPFATEVRLIDLTTDSVLFASKCQNFEDRIGLKKIEAFSGQKGILLSHLHRYALEVLIENTSGEKQDMMASMFLYFYDRDLDALLRN